MFFLFKCIYFHFVHLCAYLYTSYLAGIKSVVVRLLKEVPWILDTTALMTLNILCSLSFLQTGAQGEHKKIPWRRSRTAQERNGGGWAMGLLSVSLYWLICSSQIGHYHALLNNKTWRHFSNNCHTLSENIEVHNELESKWA
jgi:hypothetical protein